MRSPQLKLSESEPQRQWRVLISASDADSVTPEVLEIEKQFVMEALGEGTDEEVAVETICTTSQNEFTALVKEFRPNVLHFTRRGSVESNIRMLDRRGVLRQIAGTTLAKLLTQADCNLSFIFLMNCTLFREQGAILSSSDYILGLRNKERTYELPHDWIRLVYSAVGTSRLGFDAIDRISSFFANLEESWSGILQVSAKVPRDMPNSALQFVTHLEDTQRLDRGFGSAPKRSGAVEKVPSDKLPKEGQPRLFRVWFGTNRNKTIHNGLHTFGTERSHLPSYGYCDVAIPKYHRIGTLSDKWWQRFPYFWKQNRLTIEDSQVLGVENYFSALQLIFSELPSDERTLLVFIHGYNVDFEGAALRAAQLGFDLGVPGATAFFSWPSKGSIAGYSSDIASIEASEKHIADFVKVMCQKSGANRVHLIAHSMGNRGLLRAFTTMLEKVREEIGQSVHHIFLAAPDVDSDLFRDLAGVYQTVANRTTMYVSSRDRALSASGIIHDHERAGYTPPITVVSGIDTIEVSGIDLSVLGHGYVADAKAVLTDMHQLMSFDIPPNKRFGLKVMNNKDLETYWFMQR